VWRTNIFEHVCKGGPAGGGYSTVEDLLRFDQAMRRGQLVSSEMREVMWTPKPSSPSYGYGFGSGGGPGNRVVRHSGGFSGVNGWLCIHLDSGYTLAVLSNYRDGANLVMQKVQELLGVRF
jgi:CubicO group peptidase (beta-lactamase class C family)